MPKAPHAVVTGGGRGIGAATARKFKDAGYRVTVMARTRSEIESLAEEIGAYAVLVDVGPLGNREAFGRRRLDLLEGLAAGGHGLEAAGGFRRAMQMV